MGKSLHKATHNFCHSNDTKHKEQQCKQVCFHRRNVHCHLSPYSKTLKPPAFALHIFDLAHEVQLPAAVLHTAWLPARRAVAEETPATLFATSRFDYPESLTVPTGKRIAFERRIFFW